MTHRMTNVSNNSISPATGFSKKTGARDSLIIALTRLKSPSSMAVTAPSELNLLLFLSLFAFLCGGKPAPLSCARLRFLKDGEGPPFTPDACDVGFTFAIWWLAGNLDVAVLTQTVGIYFYREPLEPQADDGTPSLTQYCSR